MKASRFPSLLTALAVVWLASATPGLAESAAKAPGVTFLGMPRLKTSTSDPAKGAGKRAPSRLTPAKYTSDRLQPGGAVGAKSIVRDQLKVLTLEGGKTWKRPLRGTGRDVTFVSFLVFGSEKTVIDVGGARLSIEGTGRPGHAQLAVDGGKFSYQVKTERHDGSILAALPVVTVRLDPAAGVWDLYLFERLVAANLPVAAGAKERSFALQAGPLGAWLCGLLLSDDNPLYVDENANGIEDDFEVSATGALLAATVTPEDRMRVVGRWQDSVRGTEIKGWTVRRPFPEGVMGAQK